MTVKILDKVINYVVAVHYEVETIEEASRFTNGVNIHFKKRGDTYPDPVTVDLDLNRLEIS